MGDQQQQSGVLKQLVTEGNQVFSGFEQEQYKFQDRLIKPRGEVFFRYLNSDVVLGNIDRKAWLVLVERLTFGIELEQMGLDEAAEAYFAEVESFMLTSRSVDGFQQRQLNTSNSNVRQESTSSGEPKRGGFSFFGRRR